MSESGSERSLVASTVSRLTLKSSRSKGSPPVFSIKPGPSGTDDTGGLAKVQNTSEGGSERGSGISTVSHLSLESDRSKGSPPVFSSKPGPSRTDDTDGLAKVRNTSEGGSERGSGISIVSHLSLESDRSKGSPPVFSSELGPLRTHVSTFQPNTLEVFESRAMDFVKQSLRAHENVLSAKHKGLLEGGEQDEELAKHKVESDAETREAVLKIALHVLRTMNDEEHARILEQCHYGELFIYQRKLKPFLINKYKFLWEQIRTQQWPVPLKKIYTKLRLVDGGSGDVNSEHEVRQIEMVFNRRKAMETLIECEDIFKPLAKQDNMVRTVLTMGIAGIGKTVMVQKFILDWSEQKTSQEIQLLFSLPFRELNLLRNDKRSLMELLHFFSAGFKESGIKNLDVYRVLLVLDGLDECRLPLDFEGNESCCDAEQSASLDVLLTNLIAGRLLPKAHLWITSRPAAASCIPPKYVDRVTEVRGFNNLQKEQYFYKKIDDEDLARRVVANIRSARSLYIMCHVPVFCWISSIVLEKMCAAAGGGGKTPKTLTELYIHFLAHQITQMQLRYDEQELDVQGKSQIIMSLGKLAFQQLEKGNLIFYEEDLRDCGINVKEASVFSGMCTQVFREESWLHHKVFCFVHLSVQEFLAALYVYVTYSVSGVNLMISRLDTSPVEQTSKATSVSTLHKAAVDRALQSDNGHLDLFLRFLLGLSLKSSEVLLRGLKMQVEAGGSESHEETILYIKEKIRQTSHPEKYLNLFHCLNELNSHSHIEEIQAYLDSEHDAVMEQCCPAQWSALVFLLLTSPMKPEEFHLQKYCRTEEGLRRLLPAVKATRSAKMNDCNLTADSCVALSSTLSSSSNEVCQLTLSDNNIGDGGIKRLCAGLQSPHCRLRTLRLIRCGLTQRCCDSLALVLSCDTSRLRDLDLSHNDIADSGVELLSAGLGNTRCQLETLRLSFCNITKKGFGFLAEAVKSNPSYLQELDLSYNYPEDSGLKLMAEALEEGRCELTKFRVDHSAEHWFKPALRKYAGELTVDLDSAHKLIVLSEGGRKMSQGSEEQPYPDHPNRFDYWSQVLFQQGLQSRCYWEVEWEGNWAGIGLTYKGISRKGMGNECCIGYNTVSWSLHCSVHGYRVYHDFKSIVPRVPLAGSRRLAVYLDWEAGILTFYRVSSGRSLTHLHTFYAAFAEPLYPIFRVWGKGSSVRLCQVSEFED